MSGKKSRTTMPVIKTNILYSRKTCDQECVFNKEPLIVYGYRNSLGKETVYSTNKGLQELVFCRLCVHSKPFDFTEIKGEPLTTIK
jgi:hypothetical protein